MLIDVITLVLLTVAVFKGLRKGLIVAVASFLAFVIGLAAALKLSAAMAAYIGENVTFSQRWLPFVAFALVFILVALGVRLLARLVQRAVEGVLLGWANRLGGVLFYGLVYLFIWSVFLFYATRLGVFKTATVADSVSYGFIAPFGPKVIDALGSVIPLFRDAFTDLTTFFDSFNEGPTPSVAPKPAVR